MNTHEGNRRVRLRNIELVWQAMIFDSQGEWFTIKELERWTCLSRATVQRHLKTLAAEGRAEHNGLCRYFRRWRRL